jgi:hypothetical protein
LDESAEDYDRRMGAKTSAQQMSEHLREFSASPNGDRWFLGRNETTMNGYIVHKANEPSGGAETHIEIGAFLNRTPSGTPEHEALLRLIGTLVGGAA